VNNNLAWPHNNHHDQRHLASKSGNYFGFKMPHLLAKHSSYVSSIQFGGLGPPACHQECGMDQPPGKPGRKESGGAGRQAVKPGRKKSGPGRMAERPGRDGYLASAMLDTTRPDMLTDSSLLDFRGRGNSFSVHKKII